MTFSEKLLDLRKQENLSQEALAEKLDVSRQAVSRWESGVATPDPANLLQLSRLFAVSEDYLLADGDMNPPTQQMPLTLRQKLLLGFGIGCGIAGPLGALAMYILSRFIAVPVLVKSQLPDGTSISSILSVVSLKNFIDRYHLEALMALCIVLLTTGALMLLALYRARKKEVQPK